MGVKDEVLKQLESNKGSYISGGQILIPIPTMA